MMEIIGAFDAKTRLSELLKRTEQGETFQITKHGRPVGRLVPPDNARDHKAIAAALERLKAMSGIGGKMNAEELKAMAHEGHRC
jgi:prevent-host-death family protein